MSEDNPWSEWDWDEEAMARLQQGVISSVKVSLPGSSQWARLRIMPKQWIGDEEGWHIEILDLINGSPEMVEAWNDPSNKKIRDQKRRNDEK